MRSENRRDTVKKEAVQAARLVAELARDAKFRKRLASAIEHSTRAALRARREFGFLGTLAAALTRDQALVQELSAARRALERAYARADRKRRRRKVRTFLLVAASMSLIVLPPLRRRILASLARVTARDEQAEHTGALEEMTKEELYELAQKADVSGRSEMSKEQLVQALRARGQATR